MLREGWHYEPEIHKLSTQLFIGLVMKLDRHRIKRLDGLMFDYGLWVNGGRSDKWLFSNDWPETTSLEFTGLHPV